VSDRVELVERDLAGFLSVPDRVYPRDSPYVAPMRSDVKRYLDPGANPLFHQQHGRGTFFTARRKGEPVGRIVAHVHDDSNRRHGLARSCFGWFDCVDDEAVATPLLAAAEAWGRSAGCDEIAGNFNLTAMQQVGVLVDGFDGRPFTDMQYNAPHLPRLLERAGYRAFFPMSTFELDLDRFDPGTLLGPRQRELLAAPELTWSPLRRRGFEQQMDEVRSVLNDGFDLNPMFVPLTREEFLFQSGEMMWIIDERISMLVRERGRPIGVVVCIPDLNPFLKSIGSRLGLTAPFHYFNHRLRRERAVILFYSVCRHAQSRGLNGAMLHRVTVAMKDAGYRRLGITWIADVNAASLRQTEKLGARRLHRLSMFAKSLRSVAGGSP